MTEPENRRINILVVDDDEDTSLLLGLLLRRHGWGTIFASDLVEARKVLLTDDVAALITDVNLPDGSGLSLLAQRPSSLRAAVVVTGSAGEEQRRQSAQFGFDACIVKPFDGAKVVALLEGLLASQDRALPFAEASWCALVADDDDDSRTLMASALRRAGFTVSESANGDELVASFTERTSTRTLVVSDIGMPKCDGIKATIALKKLSPGTPVLLVTAFGDPRTLAAARDAGADQVLKKPLSFEALVRTALALTARAQV